MKYSKDLKPILPRVWYYLLDFKDLDRDNSDYIYKTYGVYGINELTYDQICELFNYAVTKDLTQAFNL